jgi:starch synthase
VAQALVDCILPRPDLLHLHDWHAAWLALLCRHDPRFGALSDIPLIYSIHSLALQGLRPLDGDPSSLAAWFPGIGFPAEDIVDPRYGDCVNPTRAALRLCDRIHAASPGYAAEILEPCDPARGLPGGEGLEQDLRQAAAEGRLAGILNGVTYPEAEQPRLPLDALLAICEPVVDAWLGAADRACHRLAARRLAAWRESQSPCDMLVTSTGPLTLTKLGLLLQPMADTRPALDHLLDALGERGRLVMLGRGDAALERAFTDIAARRDNFLVLLGEAEALGQLLYSSGDLLLMPSAFEPCGTSQLLAMRCGQPCLVHGVGGLRDTVDHGRTGFVFTGQDRDQQAIQLVACFADALSLKRDQPTRWEGLCSEAARQHFSWEDAARQMEATLYRFGGTLTWP